MLPFALEAGLTPDEFWYDDIQLVEMRCKAYEKRLDNQAWINGQYVHLALISALSAVMSKDNYVDYPDMPLTEKARQKEKREILQPSKKKYDDIALQKDQEYRDLWLTLY